MSRPLTAEERSLSLWMLQNGDPEAANFIEQLENAKAKSWRCKCGCKSFQFENLEVDNKSSGFHILGDFVFGSENNLSGIYIYESGGFLKGVEVYGLTGDHPVYLPAIKNLVSVQKYNEKVVKRT